MKHTNIFRGSRLYSSEKGVSGYILDVLPDKLTLYKQLSPVMWREAQNTQLRTIFREVNILPFDEANPHAKEMLAQLENIKSERVTEEEYAYIMWDALCGAIAEIWKPDFKHYAFTSAGYDSRLIAYAIRELYHKYGDAWLGDTWFIEADGEAEGFRKAMDLIGWGDRSVVYNEGVPVHEYHERSFDFDSAWQKFNGMCAFPVNRNWEAQAWLQEKGLMPTDSSKIQIFYGYTANEIASTILKGRSLYQYFSTAHLKLFAGPRAKVAGAVAPFRHMDVMRKVLQYGTEYIKPGTGLGEIVLKYVATKPLAEIPSPKHFTKKTTVRQISDRILRKTIADYRASWFGKRFPGVAPTNIIEYHPWWAHWCVASFCEHLIREGYEVGIDGQN